jgi:hypothetical protein
VIVPAWSRTCEPLCSQLRDPPCLHYHFHFARRTRERSWAEVFLTSLVAQQFIIWRGVSSGEHEWSKGWQSSWFALGGTTIQSLNKDNGNKMRKLSWKRRWRHHGVTRMKKKSQTREINKAQDGRMTCPAPARAVHVVLAAAKVMARSCETNLARFLFTYSSQLRGLVSAAARKLCLGAYK